MLTVSIDGTRCQGHGRCYDLEPALFEPDDAGHSLVIGMDPVTPATLLAAEHAIRNCPEHALSFAVHDGKDPTHR
jgi:ferredoxin